MKTLVIHPDDHTTHFLKDVYVDTDWTIISDNPAKHSLIKNIIDHDHIIMMGHGIPSGLYGHGRLIINSKLVYLLRTKKCSYIWCNSDQFVKQYKLSGLHTGMIISEMTEATHYSVNASADDIKYSNMLFARALKLAFQTDDAFDKFNLNYTGTSDVIKFNSHRIFKG